MPSAEDAVRAQQARKAADEAAKERELKKEVDRLWSDLQREVKLVVKRLEAKGWPDGEMITLSHTTPVTNWRGKQTGSHKNTRELAAWKIIKLENGFDPGDPDTFLYLGSDGGLYTVTGRFALTASTASPEDIVSSSVGSEDPRTRAVRGPDYRTIMPPILMTIVIETTRKLGR